MSGYIERELSRIEAALHQPQTPERHAQLYVAQQALSWATEPAGYASPFETIQREKVTGAYVAPNDDGAHPPTVDR